MLTVGSDRTRPCTGQVAATLSRTSAPTEVVWPTAPARSRPGSLRPRWSRLGRPGLGHWPCTPPIAPGARTPHPPPPAPPARPLPPPGASPSLGPRRARAQPPPLARTHRPPSAWLRTLPPLAASTRCPLRRPSPGTQGSGARRARRAPARRARSPGP